MSVPLESVAEKIFSRAKNIDNASKAVLRDVIKNGNTLVELLALLTRENEENNLFLESVIDEIFVDLHLSVTLAMGQQYRAACVVLRTCVELSLYLVYFCDHPLEAKIWANSPQNSKVYEGACHLLGRKIRLGEQPIVPTVV